MHRFPFSSGRNLLLHAALVAFLISFSHCKQQDDNPPLPKAAQANPASDCCRLTVATGLKEGMGRLVVAFPGSEGTVAAQVDLLKDGKPAQSGHGNRSWELPAGMYDVTISDTLVSGVAVQAGQETQVKVGLLHVNALTQTRIDLLDPTSGKVLTGGYGEKFYGLPVGPVSVQVAGQSETVTIEDGTVTEF